MGKVVLPSGTGLGMATLKVTTRMGAYPVGAGGEFENATATHRGRPPIQLAFQGHLTQLPTSGKRT